MSSNSNSITLIGNLTRDPELRFTTGGRAVASFGLAVNRRYQSNGEWQEQVSFFNITAWGDLGENVAATLNKGNRAIVFGRLEQREYENARGREAHRRRARRRGGRSRSALGAGQDRAHRAFRQRWCRWRRRRPVRWHPRPRSRVRRRRAVLMPRTHPSFVEHQLSFPGDL
jgi:single stranded DNA-binding protein